MPEDEQVNELAERRRLLLLEAELHRGIIGMECKRLRDRLAPVTMVRSQLAAGSPWLIGGGALAGLLAVRNWRKVIRWAPQVLTVWRLFRGRSKR